MPVNVKVINTKDFIKVTATGSCDFTASKQGILDIASHINQPGEYEVLVDIREAEVVLSTVDLFELGMALADHPSLRQSKIGILAPLDRLDKARFLELVTENRGVRIKAFTDFEQAITWLVMQETR